MGVSLPVDSALIQILLKDLMRIKKKNVNEKLL